MIKRIFRLSFLLLTIVVSIVAADVLRFFITPLNNTQEELVMVEPGMSFTDLARRLETRDIMHYPRDARYLALYARITDVASHIKSGEYRVPAHQSPARLVELLVSGKTRQYRLTLVEGWRFSDVRKAMEANDALDHRLTDKSNAEVMAALGHPDEKPEGRFMPDTYLFPRGMTDTAFLKRAYNDMANFLQKAWSKRADSTVVDTPYETLILASIIEKETAVPKERRRIAGVFSRRLNKGMLLQTDPTVIYGIPDYDGDIRRKDLQRDTPYNTYTRPGLPPTPIAMPSRESIRAVLDPMAGSSLYFVAQGDGSHVFSDTLAEHNKAVRAYHNRGS